MNTVRLKLFAQNARKILLEGVQNSLLYWGFDLNGNTLEKPEGIPGGCIFRGEVYSDPNLMRKWYNLSHYIHRHTTKDAIEQASYTWFNRLMAISILEHDSLSKPILNVSGGQFDPPLLADAKQGKMSFLSPDDQEKVKTLILEHNDEKAFGILLVGYCRSNSLLKRVFGSIDDFTELLLPGNLLSPGGILHLINSAGSVSDDEYKEVELIGWLYQFYISDKKDEVFAGFKKNIKARSEDIPAATQIFTPRWIVSYMVENTVGKIWLDHSPDSPLRGNLKYLVDSPQPHPRPLSGVEGAGGREAVHDFITDVTQLKLLDPAAGSGHILVVGFDLFMQIYREEGYTTKTAAREIIKNNLFGIDIDLRATQLACFAVLLKAASYDPAVVNEDLLPNVFAMPEADDFDRAEILAFLGSAGEKYYTELSDALLLLKQGKNIGSALKFSVSDHTRQFLSERLNELIKNQGKFDIQFLSLIIRIKPFIEVLLILSDSFEAIVTNPPYLPSKSMNADLKSYVERNYSKSSSDLFAVFMEVLIFKSVPSGKLGIINQWAWMCIDSYKEFREYFLKNCFVDSLLHLGIGVFKELNTKKVQNVALCFTPIKDDKKDSVCIKLDETYDVIEKEKQFSNKKNWHYIRLNKFTNIPGAPIPFWFDDYIILSYLSGKTLGEMITPRQGLATGDNERFVRYWYEVSSFDLGINIKSASEANSSGKKWFPYNKGGGYNKWYGNEFYVLKFDKTSRDILKTVGNNLPSEKYYFKEGVTWSLISLNFSARFSSTGHIFDVGGSSGFPDYSFLFYSLALLNSKVSSYILNGLNFTLNVQVGDIKRILFIKPDNESKKRIDLFSSRLIELSKSDFDSIEISKDFKSPPLISKAGGILERDYSNYINLVKSELSEFAELETKINDELINLYHLQNVLNPVADTNYLTIFTDIIDLAQSQIDIHGLKIHFRETYFKRDVIIQQLISYLIGCIMGRYRLYRPGLNIAHPNPSPEETDPYRYNGHTIEIDQDAIIPVLGDESPFSDDLNQKVRRIIEAIWGEQTLTENINFIEEALGIPLDKYLTQKFWDFHFKMYKKTPIYWLFESPKGYFKVLTYMHRMDKFTVQKIRLNYLHRYMEHLSSEINRLRQNGNNLRKLDTLEDALQDCRTYSDILKPLADKQITFDLDDGVKNNYKLFEGAVKPI